MRLRLRTIANATGGTSTTTISTIAAVMIPVFTKNFRKPLWITREKFELVMRVGIDSGPDES